MVYVQAQHDVADNTTNHAHSTIDNEAHPFFPSLVRSGQQTQSWMYHKFRLRQNFCKRYVSSALVFVVAFFLGVHYASFVGISHQSWTITSPSQAEVSLTPINLTDIEPGFFPDAGPGDDFDANTSTENEDLELENFKINWGALENYEFLDRLGEGEYAEVFHTIDLRNNKSCVTKVLKPVEKHMVKREIKILQDLSGGPNIVRLVDVARNSSGKSPSIVTEHVNNTYYRTLYPTFNDTDVRFYMFQLLRALEHAHSMNIMHRDIKPHNIMIDPENRKLRLIDWGLSDYYDPDYSYTTSVGSRFWRAPEILVEYEWYNLSSDIWAFGCMMAGLIFGKEPFFRGRHNNVNQLVKIAQVLGTDDLFKWLDKYEIELDGEYDDARGWFKKQSWDSLVSWQQRRLVSDEALDLVGRLLVYDHNERPTATEALAHPYFDPVREMALSHLSTFTTWDVD